MKRNPVLVLAAVLALGAAAVAATQGLTRVPPPDLQQPEAGPDAREPLEALDAPELSAWRAQLTQPDLDLREQAYGKALRSASRLPALRAALERWAAGDDPGLAWTCRLLLRELGTAGWMHALGTPGIRSLQPGTLGMPDLLRRMEELHGSLDDLFELQDPDGLGVPTLPGPGSAASAQGLQLQVGPDGVECEVTSVEDGRSVTRRYSAGSLEELLEQHPELRDRLEVRGLTGSGWWMPGVHGLVPRSTAPGAGEGAGARTDILGVVTSPLAPGRAARLGLAEGEGLLVERVERGTIADALGVRRGHVLVELNGRRLRTSSDISAALAARPAGGDLRLVLRDRYGQERTRAWKPGPVVEGAPADALRPLGDGRRL